MQKTTRAILWAVLFGAVNLLAQAQDSASSPQKLADQTFALDAGVPVLTVDEAIAQAAANHVNPKFRRLAEARALLDSTAAEEIMSTILRAVVTSGPNTIAGES